jgi:septal ring factor EnvC (AmiA/AmiB activator)
MPGNGISLDRNTFSVFSLSLPAKEWIATRSKINGTESWSPQEVQTLFAEIAVEQKRLKQTVGNLDDLSRTFSTLRARIEDYNKTILELGTQQEAMRQHTALGFSKTTHPTMYTVSST